MKSFKGKTLRWEWSEGVIELTLDHAPANEIGTAMLAELEKFVAAFDALAPETSVCIIASALKSVFSAGGDLRELYATAAAVPAKERNAGTSRWTGRPTGWRRRSPSNRPLYRSANHQVRCRDARRRQNIHHAHPA